MRVKSNGSHQANRNPVFIILAAVFIGLVAYYLRFHRTVFVPVASLYENKPVNLEKQLSLPPDTVYAVSDQDSIFNLPKPPFMDYLSYLEFVFKNSRIDIMAFFPVEDSGKHLKNLDLRFATSVKGGLAQLSKTCDGLRIQPVDGGMVLFFGNTVAYANQDDFSRLPAVYLRTNSYTGMLRLVSEELGVTIQVDKNVFNRRKRLRKARQRRSGSPIKPISLLLEKGGTIRDLLEKVSVYFGGEVRKLPTGWRIERFVSGEQLKKETRILLKELSTPLIRVVFPGSVESLSVIGQPGLPEILSYFTPDSSHKAVYLAEILGEIGGAKAASALMQALSWPILEETGSDCIRCQPLSGIIRSLVKLKAASALPHLRELKKKKLSPELARTVNRAIKELECYSWN